VSPKGLPPGRDGPAAVLYPTDLLVLAMNLCFALLSLLNCGRARLVLPGLNLDRELVLGLIFLLLDILILLFVRLLNPLRSRVAQFFRMFYVQALYTLYFTQSILLSQLFFHGRSLDAQFAWLEQFLFRSQPALIMSRGLGAGPWFNELIFFAYFSFYAMITLGPWFLYVRERYEEARRMLFIITLSFFVLYVWYAFFPVQGPKYFFPELRRMWYSNFDGYFFTHLMKAFFGSVNLAGAAVPSSHVAVALVALMLNWRDNRALFWVFLPLTVLLAFSTIYLYAHYVVDVILGAAVGVLLYIFIPRASGAVSRATARLGDGLRRRLGFPVVALSGRRPRQRLSRGRLP
jgi:membrane-associated phospholipid phosphatase